MKTTDKYKDLVISLVEKGVNFEVDAFNRNSGSNYGIDWHELAKIYGYRKPKTAYFGLGGCFYQLLQRVYNKIYKK